MVRYVRLGCRLTTKLTGAPRGHLPSRKHDPARPVDRQDSRQHDAPWEKRVFFHLDLKLHEHQLQRSARIGDIDHAGPQKVVAVAPESSRAHRD